MQLIDAAALSKTLCQFPIQCTLAYAAHENFLGRQVDGYHADAKHLCLLAPNAARALCDVQNHLNKMQLGLFVFDSYRPLRAVKDFGKWMHAPVANEIELARKAIHYPHIEKHQLAELGYVMDCVSNHCFGDTIDITLIDIHNGTFPDMGACFDFFDERSHPTASATVIGEEAYKNRMILAEAMQQAGFLPYEKEYWHYTFREREILEPMDFEISIELII